MTTEASDGKKTERKKMKTVLPFEKSRSKFWPKFDESLFFRWKKNVGLENWMKPKMSRNFFGAKPSLAGTPKQPTAPLRRRRRHRWHASPFDDLGSNSRRKKLFLLLEQIKCREISGDGATDRISLLSGKRGFVFDPLNVQPDFFYSSEWKGFY